MRRFTAVILLLICAAVSAVAQTTKVRGRVTEAGTGDPIPFAAVYFKNTTNGVTSDMDGTYSLEVRDVASTVLICHLLGYDPVEKPVNPGTFNVIDFELNLTGNELSAAFVKADNKRVKRLLANIDANRDRNDPSRRSDYACDIYNKMELDLTHAREQITNKKFVKEFGFVFDYMDTSAVSGVPYLPAMISESMVRRRHTVQPEADDETIVANRISGINPDNNLLSQFTGSMHLKVNFYRPYINSFGVEFPSPIQSGGLLYYNYYIIDSLQVDGRKTLLVRYHPKSGISSPAFDGEMQIDAETYALRSIRARMKHGGNVNWLRDIVHETEYTRVGDSVWFPSRDWLYADFSLALRDSAKMMSVLGTREMIFRNPDFSPGKAIDTEGGIVKVDDRANYMQDAYWEDVRPYDLSQKEKDIYKMVNEIQDVPLYKTAYDIVYAAVTGYADCGKISFGPYYKLLSFNNLEGLRPMLGVRTSKNLSIDTRYGGYLAYGTKDREFKGGLTYEHMFSRNITRKLVLDARYDVFQLGRSSNQFTEGNILASILGKGDAQRLCPMKSVSAYYEHEFSTNFTLAADITHKRFYANQYVPMVARDGSWVPWVTSNELHLRGRISRDETVTRGYFVKKYIHTNYPVLTLDVTASPSGISPGDCAFVRPEITLDWKKQLPPFGMTKVRLNAGTIFGSVPYPYLHLHEGNGTYILDKSAFSCMDYFEFASDTWATLLWHHNFGGWFLGKIPVLRKLQLREEVTFKAAYGSLREENDPRVPGSAATMQFPEGTYTMDGIPYMEVGAGVSNILRVFRVDCVWRLSHLTHEYGGVQIPARHPFCVTLGAELRF